MPEPQTITLLTDFGTADGYAAAMRGVIASRAPAVSVYDASHEIAAGDIHAAAYALRRYWQTFPPGTVHVVVVDPGVGSARRALAVEADGRFGVGPDNGVLDALIERANAIHALTETALFLHPVSATFHGRDVFAPTAAYLACGGLLQRVGPRIADALRLPPTRLERTAAAVLGEVIHIDRFGNLVTNIPAPVAGEVELDGRSVGSVRHTYADVARGELVALIGSAGVLEIAVRDGNAAERLRAYRGAPVRVLP
jgi:S-adenosylmethionine hydrolase